MFSSLTTSLVCPSAQGAIVHKPRRRAPTLAAVNRQNLRFGEKRQTTMSASSSNVWKLYLFRIYNFWRRKITKKGINVLKSYAQRYWKPCKKPRSEYDTIHLFSMDLSLKVLKQNYAKQKKEIRYESFSNRTLYYPLTCLSKIFTVGGLF